MLATLSGTPAAGTTDISAADTRARNSSPGSAESSSTLTLINGDKVTVTGSGTGPAIEIVGSQGQPVSADTVVIGGETYVYPHEVLPYLAAGTLDRQLFNITRLIEYGYDDARTDRLPMIIRYADADGARTAKAPEGSETFRHLSSVQGAAVARLRDQATVFWSSLTAGVDSADLLDGDQEAVLAGGVEHVWLDGKVQAALSDTVAQIGAPQVWKDGNTGQGVDVAVLDTGVDSSHPDLADRIAATKSFVPGQAIDDADGHGTHVASTISGTGAASGGQEKGVAPGARLHIGKALDDTGSGQDSWVLAAMEWAARDQRARIVSMSLGGGPTDGTDPLSLAVNSLSKETGALFTIAAGNSFRNFTVGSPGAADAALTVGAVDSQDALAGFSSRGPRLGDFAVKPEITAPGVDVLAARSRWAPGEGAYTSMSGTSMATPHVAGAAALLAAEHPDWTGAQLKEVLISTAKATPGDSPFEAGNGRVDTSAATTTPLYATGVVSMGLHEVPAAPETTVERKVTYSNTSSSPVALDLTLDAGASPAGLFALSASTVTVPARSSATITVAAHLDSTVADHVYSARIKASQGSSVMATTSIGLATESEKAVVNLTVKDRSGKPATGAITLMAQRAGGTGQDVANVPVGSSARLRLEPGLWSFTALVDVEGLQGPNSRGRALLTQPEINLNRDMSITLDASKAQPVKAVTPKESVTSYMRIDFTRSLTEQDSTRLSVNLLPKYDSFFVMPTDRPVTKGAMKLRVRWRNEEPALTLSHDRRPVKTFLVRRGAHPLPTGNSRLDTIYVGRGTPEDYAGVHVRGKAALVQRDANLTWNDQAATAAAAGAKALIVADPGPIQLDPRTESTPPLTVITVGHDEGLRLMALGERSLFPLNLSYDRETDYLYDLVTSWDKSLPRDPTYRPRAHDLTRVNVAFENHRAGDAAEFRYDFEAGDAGLTTGFSLPRPSQGTRTDWVTSGTRTQWQSVAQVASEIRSVGAPVTYQHGSITRERWFAPLTRPRSLDFRAAQRTIDTMTFYIPGWSDAGAAREGFARTPDAQQTSSLYQGDKLVASSGDFLIADGLKPSKLPYRYVVETRRGAWKHPYSTHTKTVWNLTSGAGGPEEVLALPLIQLDYDIDTDPDGRATRHARLNVSPSHLASPDGEHPLPPTSAIGKVSVEVSYDDGITWLRSSMTHTREGWRTNLDAPRHAAHASVRTTASDDRGNTVSQTIIRAFGLK
ncbi:S8 family serine peptidase [Streptomyces sp. NPDC048171]|uniref:S8 family serine peptidase n=1 Tax=Streptomyces sp. NPDC048171 TaxID=3365504 RepID=UPI003713BEFD